MKKKKSSKRIMAMMAASVLSLWFASPDIAQAKTIQIEGRNINMTLTASPSTAIATISFTEGSGQVKVCVTGQARSLVAPNVTMSIPGPLNSNPTPGGVSSTVSALEGWKFEGASAQYGYDLDINGTRYSGEDWDSVKL